ncbi:hypothetical protein ACFLYU_05500, partial [Candidatus Dependentiae bacterium]
FGEYLLNLLRGYKSLEVYDIETGKLKLSRNFREIKTCCFSPNNEKVVEVYQGPKPFSSISSLLRSLFVKDKKITFYL